MKAKVNAAKITSSKANASFKAALKEAPLAWGAALALLALVTKLIFLYNTPLIGDEYLYWFWGANLAAGYPDHPPFIAYLFRVSELLFGRSAGGVRLVNLLLFLALAGYLYHFGKRVRGVRLGIILALLATLLPVYFSLSAIVTPDSPLILFLFLSLCFYYRAFFEGRRRFFLIAGVFLGGALLSKLSAALSGMGIFVYVVLSKRRIILLKNPYFWGSFAVAGALCVPFIYWNFMNDFVSVRFVLNRINLPFSWERFFVFWLVQLIFYLPPYFILFLLLFYEKIKNYYRDEDGGEKTEKYFFLASSALFPLGYLLYKSLSARVEPNWSLVAFVPLTFLLAFYLEERWEEHSWRGRKWVSGKKLFYWSNLTSVLAMIFLVLQISFSPVPAYDGATNRYYNLEFLEKEFKGYYEKHLDKSLRLLSNTYQVPSAFNYLIAAPRPTAYCLPLGVYHYNLYDLLYKPEDLIGENFYYLIRADDQHNQPKLFEYFEAAELIKTFTSYRKEKAVASYNLYLVKNYLGHPRRYRD